MLTGLFLNDAFPTLKFDYAMANPPFNISDWWQPQLEGDVRWKYGQPPAGNANFAWLQHIIHHLAPRGTAGVVLANGSMSSQQSGEGDIRKAMIEGDVVDCMARLFDGGAVPAEHQANLLAQFRLAMRGRGLDVSNLDEQEIWAFGQHHGLRTPLIDWTKSPYDRP